MVRRYKPRCTGSVKERIEGSVKKSESGCWLWTGAINPANGYGYLGIDGKTHSAHRFAYRAFVGEIPDGLFVMHKCDVRECCNPDHLMLGTHRDNMRDMLRKRRYPTGDKHYNTKVSDASVVDIKRRKQAGESADVLAAEYGVSKYTIWGIVSGKWRTS